MSHNKGKVYVFYHFYKPDPVVSAVHFSDFCEGLVKRGWDVTVYTSNRYCRTPDKTIDPLSDTIEGVHVKRIWRPNLNQGNHVLRLINSGWMQASWLFKCLLAKKPEAYVVGTDPQFSQFMFPFLWFMSPKSKRILWCFDLYPEAIEADMNSVIISGISRVLKRLSKWSYKLVDVMVDIGPCMRERLDIYQHKADKATLVPWALSEPDDLKDPKLDVRQKNFGDCKLALLYSGTLGKAHEYKGFLQLARLSREENLPISFAFSASGNRFQELKQELTDEDSNINILPFAALEELEDRLLSADVHMMSLREEWAGIVVPSKFFGTLASGRPVLYQGPENSAIFQWINKFDTGFVLDVGNVSNTLNQLRALIDQPEKLKELNQCSRAAYHQNFSKEVILDKWDELLSAQLDK